MLTLTTQREDEKRRRRRYECHHCRFFTYNCYTLTRHMERQHPGGVEIICARRDCRRRFPTWRGLRAHEVLCHCAAEEDFADVRWHCLAETRWSPDRQDSDKPNEIGLVFMNFYTTGLLRDEREKESPESPT
jgi:hypothetical protein